MELVIAQLKEGENPFTFSSVNDAWMAEIITDVEKQGYRLKSPLTSELSLVNSEPEYYLTGKLHFDVEQSCSRCADNFKLHIDHPFHVSLVHIANYKAKIKENADNDTDLDVNFFEGNEINLAPLLEEQFFLSIPYQVVCKDSCLGICQH